MDGVPGHLAPSRFGNAWTGPFGLARDLPLGSKDAWGPARPGSAVAKVERQSTLESTRGLTPTCPKFQTLET